MGWVELHEHTWGVKHYLGRPSLNSILEAPIVTFWRPATNDKQPRYKIKLYKNLEELERYYSKLVLRANIEVPQERLTRIFSQRKQMVVTGVKMLFREVEK